MKTDPTPSLRRRDRLIRTRMIRRRAIGAALALFVAAWLTITVALASGHDPVLSTRKASSTTASATTAQTTSAQTTTAQTTMTPTTTTQTPAVVTRTS